jgi:uncharacterized protein YhhL (DUF1145 family)
MNKQTRVSIGKVIVSFVWLLITASVWVPSQVPFSGVFLGVGGFLVIAHIYEIVVYRRLMRGVGDYLGTFFFGLLQLQTIKSQRLR